MAMNNPDTYRKYCEIGGNIVWQILSEVKDKMTFEDEHVLDVGCGPGINTSRNLVRFLPRGTTIVASDLSASMIEFAKGYCPHPQITFKTLDIGDKNLWTSWKREEFSKIFSFYTLHRVPNLKQGYENIYSLLKPGGELFFVTPVVNGMDKIFPYLAKLSKYSKYSEQISKLRVMINPTENYENLSRELLEETGFEVKINKCEEKPVYCPTLDYLIDYYGAVSFLSHVLPKDLFQEALSDSKKIIIDNKLFEQNNDGFILKYVLLICLAKKPNERNN